MSIRTLCVRLGLAACVLSLAAAQTAKLETKPISNTSVSGADMYKTYCASCHGMDGKGQGPASKALKVPASDLTKIAQHNNGQFPKEKIIMSLGLMPASGAHGSSDMPVWGDLFRASHHDEAMVKLRLGNLTDYLETMQDPPPAAKPKVHSMAPAPKSGSERVILSAVPMDSGVEMYKAYCASCHGIDGKGAGPVAKTLKARPSDLTVLAKANGGNFPGNKVMSILGAMPGTDAHGSKEMPIWGDALRANNQRPEVVRLRLANITDYVKSMQTK